MVKCALDEVSQRPSRQLPNIHASMVTWLVASRE